MYLGEIPAMVIIDSVVGLLPGVLATLNLWQKVVFSNP
jgi:tRNA G37 N-methylase TrmD